MSVGFEAFLWSLTQQESGGRYGAVGPWVGHDRAYGRYQVMGNNIPSWTARYYGRRLSPAEFLHNAAAQDAVVRGVLGGYYKKYGAAGAAAMWYSGQPNPHKTYGNPPVYSYVNSVLSRARGYSGGGGGGGFTYGAPVKVSLSRSELAASYGLSSALINSSKSLRSLFNKAVAGQWSAAKFQASLKNSSWWKNQSSTLRKYLTQKYTDPATWKQSRSASLANLKVMAAQVGLDIAKIGSKTWDEAVYNDLALGWSDARLKNWLGAKVQLTKGGFMLGEAGEAFDKLHELAYLNGVKYSQSWYRDQATKIVKGTSTLENQEQKIRANAAARYSAFADQIRAGQNAIDLAAPYIKSVSTLLEMPETEVDLFDPLVHNAMSGSHAGANFPLWEFENAVRNDPRWRKTNNARESMFGVAHQVAKDFGLSY